MNFDRDDLTPEERIAAHRARASVLRVTAAAHEVHAALIQAGEQIRGFAETFDTPYQAERAAALCLGRTPPSRDVFWAEALEAERA